MNSMINYDANVIGERIRDIRKKNGYTQNKLSEQLMLSVDSVSNIENGKTTCMPEHIMRLCQLFNVSADYFYFGGERLFEEGESDLNSMLEKCDKRSLYLIEQIVRYCLILCKNV